VNTWYQTQGRLEIKWRKVELGVVHFGDRVEGRQRSGANGCVKTHSRELSNSRCCGQILGEVQVRTASVPNFPGKSITAVPVTESIDQGCNVELTQLETNGNAWWSLAFGAFGEDDCLMEHLQAVASCVFKSYRGQTSS